MNYSIFLLLPSPRPTGPIKGAFALANYLAPIRDVTIVYLKQGPGVDAYLDQRVKIVHLSEISESLLGRLLEYKSLLKICGGRKSVASISMCFSADFFNLFLSSVSITCASVRGNLLQNYRCDYGLFGIPFSFLHFIILRKIDHVLAMTEAMRKQIYKTSRVQSKVIGNFIDEKPLESIQTRFVNKKGPLRFIFLGSLTKRKRPDLLVKAIKSLVEQGQEVKLDIVGEGPLMNELEQFVLSNNLNEYVHLHGQLKSPYQLMQAADVFVLPSLSEGVSRASLEALFLGVPCVLRDVDGNSDLLSNPFAGLIFSDDDELASTMLRAARLSKSRRVRKSLLPLEFQQKKCAGNFLELIEGSK